MFQLKTKRKIINIAVAGACAWMVTPVHAQQVAGDTQVITVTGFRAAAEDGLNIKRTSDGFVDAISADGLGRFPDLNVGEALTRIPGIQLDRTQGDRQATISLRGLPGSYVRTTVNGLAIADPLNSENGSPLGTFSSDVFNRFVVNKSPSASDVSGGIAGVVDLQFNGALARKDGGDITVKGEYNTLGGGTSPAITLRYNKHLTPDFAVFGTYVNKTENFRRDVIDRGTTAQIFDPYPNQQGSSYNNPSTGGGGGLGYRVVNIQDFVDYYANGLVDVNGSAPNSVAGQYTRKDQNDLYLTTAPGLNCTKTLAADDSRLLPYPQKGLYIQAPCGYGSNQQIAPTALGNSTAIVGTGLKSNNGVQIVNNISQNTRESKGENQSFTGGFEYRVNKRLKFDVTALVADKNLNQASNQSISSNFIQGGARLWVDPSSVYISKYGNAYADRFTYDNAQVNSTSRGIDYVRTQIRGVSSSITWNNDDWRVLTNINFSKARGISDQVAMLAQVNTIGTGTLTNQNPSNGIYGSISGGMGDIANSQWSLFPNNPLQVPTFRLRLDSPGNDPSNPLQVAVSNPGSFRSTPDINLGSNTPAVFVSPSSFYRDLTNTVAGVKQTFERQLSDLPISSVNFGYNYELNKFKSFNQTAGVYGIPIQGVTNPALISGTAPSASSFFGNSVSGYNTNWQTTDYNFFLNNLTPTAASLIPGNQPVVPGVTYNAPTFSSAPYGFPTPLQFTPRGFVVNSNNPDNFKNNFSNDYKIFGTFVQANFEQQIGGVRVRGNVGLRHESTSKKIVGSEQLATVSSVSGFSKNVVNPVLVERSYSYNLPSFMAALDVGKDVVLRYGAYETYTRPARAAENPISTITRTENTNNTTWKIENLGRKTLVPYTSISQDLGLEWYNRKGSVVALTVYQKKVKGQTYDFDKTNTPEVACPADGIFDGKDYGLGALTYDPQQQKCSAVKQDNDNLTANKPVDIIINASGGLNNTNAFTVRGVEFSVQQNLSFLPAPWSNFGGIFNYSRTNINGTYPNGRAVYLPYTAKQNTNLIGYYDQGPFSFRLIYNKRGEVFISGGDSTKPELDRFAKPRGQLDLSTSWKFKSGVTIALDIANLNNALVEQWQDDERSLRNISYDGRTATLSLRAPF